MGKYAGPDRRKVAPYPRDAVPVRLTHKYADVIDDVDLSGHDVGERLYMSYRAARLLVAEGWAEPVPEQERRRSDWSGFHRGR
ncbi:MAG TPA: hypothetical protein VG871_24115 [Vicinamibacterales bacterium]|nr:hypothetical protein [Vicinamibacterales bacterium]